jgi:hypothetical protein
MIVTRMLAGAGLVAACIAGAALAQDESPPFRAVFDMQATGQDIARNYPRENIEQVQHWIVRCSVWTIEGR